MTTTHFRTDRETDPFFLVWCALSDTILSSIEGVQGVRASLAWPKGARFIDYAPRRHTRESIQAVIAQLAAAKGEQCEGS